MASNKNPIPNMANNTNDLIFLFSVSSVLCSVNVFVYGCFMDLYTVLVSDVYVLFNIFSLVDSLVVFLYIHVILYLSTLLSYHLHR